MKERGLVIDFTYTLVEPYFTKWVRWPYRMLNNINPNFVDLLIKLAESRCGRYFEYYAEELFFGYNLFSGRPSLLVPRHILAQTHESHKIVLSSREPLKNLERVLNRLGCSPYIDAIVCRNDVGYGVTRKEHIRKGIEQLCMPQSFCTLVSDSPPDLKKGKELGVRTYWVRNGYHQRPGQFQPDDVFNSTNEALLSLINEVESVKLENLAVGV